MFSTFSIIFSLFFVISIGFILAKKGHLKPESLKDMKFLLTRVILPVLLFRSITKADISEINILGLYLTYYIGLLIIYFIYLASAIRYLKSSLAEASVGAAGCVFSNNLFVAYPIILAIWGESLTVLLFVILFIHAALVWTLSSIFIEINISAGKGNLGKIILHSLSHSIREPIILGIIAALLFRLLDTPLPHLIARSFDLLVPFAMPLALIMLGAEVTRFSLRGNVFHAFIIMLFKNFGFPTLVFLLGYYIFQISPNEIKVTTIMAACPMGVFVYILATHYNVYTRRAASAFLLSNAMAPFTLIFIILLLEKL